MTSKPVEELAHKIPTSAKVVSDYLTSERLPQPSFEVDAPLQWPQLPSDVFGARSELRDATKKLHDLATGHRNLLTWFTNSWTNIATLQWISRFKIADAIPLDRVMPYTEIAKTANVDENLLRRFLRHAMTFDIFCEPRPAMVAHTAQSSMLVKTHIMSEYTRWNVEEIGRWSMYTADAYEKWGHKFGSDGHTSQFNLANGTEKTMFDVYSEPGQEDKMVLFGNYMRGHDGAEGYDKSLYVHGYDWGALGEATVVDVGGGHGHISSAIAREFPQLKFIIQDLSDVVAHAETLWPTDMKGRATFQTHNFFQLQPCHGADVYLFKHVLHDWTDEQVIEILKNTAIAMRPGSRVLIVDGVVPEPGTFKQHEESAIRYEYNYRV
ncbi:MAG: hypothetical protein M1822_007046 [Bathelium mastoideum]|nr:MAG: hypothetical protein M1822_007046 [Bathelium mastoideum]